MTHSLCPWLMFCISICVLGLLLRLLIIFNIVVILANASLISLLCTQLLWYASHKTLALGLTYLLNGIMVTIDILKPFPLCKLESNLPTTKKKIQAPSKNTIETNNLTSNCNLHACFMCVTLLNWMVLGINL